MERRLAFGLLRLDRLVPITQVGRYTLRIILRGLRIYSSVGNTELESATLTSNALTLNVLPARPDNPFPQAAEDIGQGDPGTTPTGPQTDGFALSLTHDFNARATVELRNVSGGPRRISFGSRDAYRFTIKNLRTGQTISVTGDSLHGRGPLAPGGELLYPDTSLYALFDLQRMHRLNSDRYRIVVAGYPIIEGITQRLVSNSIVLVVPFTKPYAPLKRPVTSVLGMSLQSNRPVYVVGEPVLLRAALTDRTDDPMAIWEINSQLTATYETVHGAATTQRCSLYRPPVMSGGRLVAGLSLAPHSTTRFLNFRYDSPWQHDFTSMGCSFTAPGTYSLVGEARLDGIVEAFDANFTSLIRQTRSLPCR